MLFCQLLESSFSPHVHMQPRQCVFKGRLCVRMTLQQARAKLTTFPASATVFCIVVYCTVSLLPASFITFITHRVLVKIVSVPERGNILGVNNDRYHQSNAYPNRTNCNFSDLCSALHLILVSSPLHCPTIQHYLIINPPALFNI